MSASGSQGPMGSSGGALGPCCEFVLDVRSWQDEEIPVLLWPALVCPDPFAAGLPGCDM